MRSSAASRRRWRPTGGAPRSWPRRPPTGWPTSTAGFATLQEEQSAARAAGARVEQLDVRQAELAGRLAAARRRDELRASIAVAEPRALTLRTEALDAREHSQNVRERRLTGMAAELAAQLRSGEACRVCGSPEHPGKPSRRAARSARRRRTPPGPPRRGPSRRPTPPSGSWRACG